MTILPSTPRSASALILQSKNNLKLLHEAFSAIMSSASSNSDEVYTVAITGPSGLLGSAVIDELFKKENDQLNGKTLRILQLIRTDTIGGKPWNGDNAPSSNKLVTKVPWNPNVNPNSEEEASPIDHIR
eukprot:CAMPEP_0195273716 /NCGR_PEP_ID=MMETSP0706-20130129/16674_1 /TAXON_ID=33640 /ORGANISM="Asterionellopsis glacialis, Strain CCMP134" /LENGTH=128 /DNA_ID=CAMNT_0040330357 /DNA_START=95 /DNA_END=477 /DNA_ORIENTATION=+